MAWTTQEERAVPCRSAKNHRTSLKAHRFGWSYRATCALNGGLCLAWNNLDVQLSLKEFVQPAKEYFLVLGRQVRPVDLLRSSSRPHSLWHMKWRRRG